MKFLTRRARSLAFLALLAARPPASSTPQAPVIVTEIETPAAVSAALFGDVDADGRKDLVLLMDRQVLVHRLLPDGHLTPAPSVVVKLPPNAIAIDLQPFEPPETSHAIAKARLFVATTEGLFLRDLSSPTADLERIPLPALEQPLIPLASGAAPIAMSILDEFGGDAVPEIFLPTATGMAVFQWKAGAWSLLGIAETRLAVKIESGDDRPGAVVRQSFELPRAAVIDTAPPGQAARRFLTITREHDCHVYAATENGLALIEQARGLYRFDDEDRLRDIRGTRRNDDVNDRSVGFVPVDINGDGIPDFVSSRFKDGQVFITYGREGAFAAGTPDKVIDVDGWVILAQSKDLDGDGLPDLVVPRLAKLGISGAIKALLQRKIDLELWAFRNRGGADAYASSPDWKHTLEVEVQLGGDGGKFSATARMIAGFFDVNGDGRRDFITSRDDDKLSIFLGTPDSLMSARESLAVPIPSTAKESEVDLRSCDVNDDKREDLLVLYGSNRKGVKNKLYFILWAPEGAPR